MPSFPKKEAQIYTLANQMIAGYKAHAADFPSTSWISLSFRRVWYENARGNQLAAHSQLQLATQSKRQSLNSLKRLMKNYLEKSEVDIAVNPEKLSLIGWSPRQQPQPIETPGQPVNLHPDCEGPGTIRLIWDSPTGDSPIRNYVIEKRIYLEDNGRFGPWQIAGTSFDNETNLKNQPTGIQLEYRVKAVNTAGESPYSNTVAVVL